MACEVFIGQWEEPTGWGGTKAVQGCVRENHTFWACIILIRRRIIEEELLIMNDLRTTGWEESGWRYANQPLGG